MLEDGSVPIGISCRNGKELKNLIRLGARLDRIVEVLHYSDIKDGKLLIGKAIEEFDKINLGRGGGREGELEGNQSSYGSYGITSNR